MTIYMQFDDISGAATVEGHEEWIPIDSIQWGVGRAISSAVGTSADRESSKPSISEISVTKMMDQSSPLLFTEACVGKGTTVTIHLCVTGSDSIDTYMEYELENCMISGYSVSSGGDRPSESLSLSFTQMIMTFTPYDKEGNPESPIPSGYNMETGTKV